MRFRKLCVNRHRQIWHTHFQNLFHVAVHCSDINFTIYTGKWFSSRVQWHTSMDFLKLNCVSWDLIGKMSNFYKIIVNCFKVGWVWFLVLLLLLLLFVFLVVFFGGWWWFVFWCCCLSVCFVGIFLYLFGGGGWFVCFVCFFAFAPTALLSNCFTKQPYTTCMSFRYTVQHPLGYFSFQPVPTTGVTKVVVCAILCRMIHIKEPLLLIGKIKSCGGNVFPLSLSEWSFTICLTPYNRK